MMGNTHMAPLFCDDVVTGRYAPLKGLTAQVSEPADNSAADSGAYSSNGGNNSPAARDRCYGLFNARQPRVLFVLILDDGIDASFDHGHALWHRLLSHR
jgi:hypothetical protein